MKTRREIEVAMERAGATMAHYLEAIHNAPDLRFTWDLAHGEWQQINHLTGTPSYEALEAENKQLRDALAKQPPIPDVEYGELRALAEAAKQDQWQINDLGGKLGLRVHSGYQAFFNLQRPSPSLDAEVRATAAFVEAAKPSAILSLLDSRAQLAERVAVLEATEQHIHNMTLEQAAMICDAQQLEGECQERAAYCAEAIRALKVAPHPHADEAAKVEWISVDPEVLRRAREWIEEHSSEPGYGFYRPANPHDFHPDAECCSEEEITAHKAACDAYNKGEYTPEGGCVGGAGFHILRAPWGVGSYTCRDEEAEALLADLPAPPSPAEGKL